MIPFNWMKGVAIGMIVYQLALLQIFSSNNTNKAVVPAL